MDNLDPIYKGYYFKNNIKASAIAKIEHINTQQPTL